MKKSVSVIFKKGDEIYAIKRQNYLRVFPGYHAFPGGKVDKEDSDFSLEANHKWSHLPKDLLGALVREVQEELGVNIVELDKKGMVGTLHLWSKAITPEFNPYRFCNYYFILELNENISFTEDVGEIAKSYWQKAERYLTEYENGELLCVPVFLEIIKRLNGLKITSELIDLSPVHLNENVPVLTPLGGIKQLLPLSHTFPPANRTNSFVIGDEDEGTFIIDPSPKDLEELDKFINSIGDKKIKALFITHHHRDHYEYANVLAKRLNLPVYLSEPTFKRITKKDDANFFKGIELHFVKEGDYLTKWNKEDVFVYEVPGHDDGQVAIAPSSMKWFLVGDLIQTIGTVVVGGEEGDMAKYFNSLKRVIDLRPSVVLPSHGIAIGGVNKLVETLEHRVMRENHIKELMAKNCDEDEMMKAIYPELEERLHRYARKTIRAHVDKIKGEE